jgi:hypothetical protein
MVFRKLRRNRRSKLLGDDDGGGGGSVVVRADADDDEDDGASQMSRNGFRRNNNNNNRQRSWRNSNGSRQKIQARLQSGQMNTAATTIAAGGNDSFSALASSARNAAVGHESFSGLAVANRNNNNSNAIGGHGDSFSDLARGGHDSFDDLAAAARRQGAAYCSSDDEEQTFYSRQRNNKSRTGSRDYYMDGGGRSVISEDYTYGPAHPVGPVDKTRRLMALADHGDWDVVRHSLEAKEKERENLFGEHGADDGDDDEDDSSAVSGDDDEVRKKSPEEEREKAGEQQPVPEEDDDASTSDESDPGGHDKETAERGVSRGLSRLSSGLLRDWNQYKVQVEQLIEAACPDQLGNMGAMLEQFAGREEELLHTLRQMAARTKHRQAAVRVHRCKTYQRRGHRPTSMSSASVGGAAGVAAIAKASMIGCDNPGICPDAFARDVRMYTSATMNKQQQQPHNHLPASVGGDECTSHYEDDDNNGPVSYPVFNPAAEEEGSEGSDEGQSDDSERRSESSSGEDDSEDDDDGSEASCGSDSDEEESISQEIQDKLHGSGTVTEFYCAAAVDEENVNRSIASLNWSFSENA